MRNHPDIFGYCGDVLFVTTVISQIIDQADSQILFSEGMSAQTKFDLIFSIIRTALTPYPPDQTTGSFVIIYATRDIDKNFHCYRISWNSTEGITSSKIKLPSFSGVVTVEGSGKDNFNNRFFYEHDHEKKNNNKTSRTVYHCFTETIDNNADYRVGGAPQVVGLYRIRNARFFGIVVNSKRFFMGQEISSGENLNFVEWRNDLFERYDPKELKILESAQRQPRS